MVQSLQLAQLDSRGGPALALPRANHVGREDRKTEESKVSGTIDLLAIERAETFRAEEVGHVLKHAAISTEGAEDRCHEPFQDERRERQE